MQRAKRTQINHLESGENTNYFTISGKEGKHRKEIENIKRPPPQNKIGTEEISKDLRNRLNEAEKKKSEY